MAEGVFPDSRHDLSPWRDEDSTRAEKQGTAMRYRCCLLYIKGDWSEYASTVGLPSWEDGLRPCYYCNSTLEHLYEYEGLSLFETPFRNNEDDDYFTACTRCEQRVVIDRAMHGVLIHRLENDRRPYGNHGRCLSAAVESLGLLLGDRLEPSPWLPDVGDFESIDIFPFPLCFWRSSNEYITRHRNPIFDRELGITPSKSLTVDVLHCINLGVLLVWCRHVVWMLIVSHVWTAAGTLEEVQELSALAIRNDLKSFYKAHRTERPGDNLTQVGNFTKKMLGDHSDQKLKTKGAETWFFSFPFTEIAGCPCTGRCGCNDHA